MMENEMDDFDPYAEPNFDLEQTKSPQVLRPQNNARKEKIISRAEFEDVDPHLTLSYNGLPIIFSRNN